MDSYRGAWNDLSRVARTDIHCHIAEFGGNDPELARPPRDLIARYEGGSEFHIATAHFQTPPAGFFQISRYLPRSVTRLPLAFLNDSSKLPRE